MIISDRDPSEVGDAYDLVRGENWSFYYNKYTDESQKNQLMSFKNSDDREACTYVGGIGLNGYEAGEDLSDRCYHDRALVRWLMVTLPLNPCVAPC